MPLPDSSQIITPRDDETSVVKRQSQNKAVSLSQSFPLLVGYDGCYFHSLRLRLTSQTFTKMLIGAYTSGLIQNYI